VAEASRPIALASANRRLAARFAELPAGVAIVGVMVAAGWAIERASQPDDPGHGIAYVVLGIGMLVAALYEVVLTGLLGQTVGKRLLGVKVVSRVDGSPPGIARSLIRSLVLWSNWLLTAAALLMIYADKERRRGLHDLAAGTVVIDVR
jgi:uncharacterized RDD family membrane protein YckC